MGYETIMRHAETPGFKALAKDSEGRNRGPSKELLRALDPSGKHVVAFSMVHSDCELRNVWLCKLKGEKEPVRVYMDNGLDEFNTYTATATI
tara:strand:+ start:372 stop:647 length:276 start_codon:yes stop_codon:yes gene_type:complete